MEIRSTEEARRTFREIIELAHRGETVIITRRGIAAVKIAPLSPRDVKEYRERLAELEAEQEEGT